MTIKSYIAKHHLFQELLRNASILFGGNMLSSLINFLILVLLTKTLSMSDFGVYALIVAFVSIVERLTSFQTWQSVVYYGTRMKVDSVRLSEFIGAMFSLDIIACFVGCIVFLNVALFVPGFIGVPDSHVDSLLVAGVYLLINVVSAATGVFRLYNKFVIQAAFQNIMAGARLIGVVGVYVLTESDNLLFYMLAWGVGGFVGRVYFVIECFKLLLKNNINPHISLKSLRNTLESNKGMLQYLISTNLDGIVRVFRDVDVFIVNFLIGLEATAIYKLARELTRIATRLTGPFYQAIYPQLSDLVGKKDYASAKTLIKQSSLTVGGMVLCGLIIFTLFGKFGIELIWGEEYMPVYGVTLCCLAAMLVWAGSLPISPALLAFGKARLLLNIHVVSTLFYLVLLLFFVYFYGVIGAGMALFIFYVLWSAIVLYSLMKLISKKEKEQK